MVAGTLSTSLVNNYWYRVAGLTPRLREQLRVHAQRYRGQLWYVVEDRVNNKYHRFDAQAYRILKLLDGTITLDQLWHRLAAQPDEHTPSQEDILGLLGQLHGLDLLAGGALPDLAELGQRNRRHARQRLLSRYLNPLALRFHLLDPDRTLGKAVGLLAPVLNRWGAVAWLAWVLPAVVLAAAHWRELTSNFGERLLALDNLLLLGLIFPLVKVLHELGHGVACKLREGEVHDMGVMLLLFLPVPYVDASSAWAFPNKRDRMLVGAAGMLVELMLAAGAFYLWLYIEPGVAKGLAYDVAVLASVTTVVFNGNPLLRYDGYYIASDALEIPNLGQRAAGYWGYLIERYVLGRRSAASPAMAPGEPFWFVLYAPLALAYRLFVMFWIAVFVSTKYLFVGMLMIVSSLAISIGMPLYRGAGRLSQLIAQDQARGRLRRKAAFLLVAIVLILVALPLPHRTQVDGVLWLPDDAVLRIGQSGFVREVGVRPGVWLNPGDLVARLDDPALATEIEAQSARLEQARIRYEAVRMTDPAQGQQLGLVRDREAAVLAALQARAEKLVVRSKASGSVWLDAADDLEGRYLREGRVLGYVIPQSAPTVRVIVDQADEDFIRQRTSSIAVRAPFAAGEAWPAVVLRAVPAASTELPSAALGRQGGGDVAIDPRDESGRKALVSHFEYELALPGDFPYRALGSRVSVRFEHPMEPLGFGLWRAGRRLFLGHFHV